MRRVLLFLFLFQYSFSANYITLSNDKVIFSVMDAGAIGTGIESDGYQNVKLPALKPNIQNIDKLDFINVAGIPFEFFSLAIDDKIYANDNAEGYKKRWPYSGMRDNARNIPTTIRKINDKTIQADTKLENKFRILHIYTLDKTHVKVKVSVTYLGNGQPKIVYTRGIDMDPPGVDTDCKKGYSGSVNGQSVTIPGNDIIYTAMSDNTPSLDDNKYPLSLFSNDKNTSHATYITYFDGGNGCLYDYKKIKQLDKGSEFNHDDGVAYMVFFLGTMSHGATKSFTFQYVLDKNVLNLMKTVYKGYLKKSDVLVNVQKIRYKNTNRYEKVVTDTFTLKQKGGKRDKKVHKAKIQLNHSLLRRFPKGLFVKVNGQKVTANNAVKFTFKYGNPVKFEIWRNKDFKEKGESIISLLIKKDIGVDDEVKIPIKPVRRNISFVVENFDTNIVLTQLKNSPPIQIKILADNKEITPEEYKEFELNIDVNGLDFKTFIDSNTHKYFIKLLPEFPLCLTNIGSIPIKISVDKGFYPGDTAEKTLHVNIQDVSWWEKCKEVVINILIVLFILWYLFCIFIRKNKFNSYQALSCARPNQREKTAHFSEMVPWWQKLIPCKSEWVWHRNMLFLAYDGTAVKLSKKTLNNLKINKKTIKQSTEDEIVYPNDTIERGMVVCRFRLTNN